MEGNPKSFARPTHRKYPRQMSPLNLRRHAVLRADIRISLQLRNLFGFIVAQTSDFHVRIGFCAQRIGSSLRHVYASVRGSGHAAKASRCLTAHCDLTLRTLLNIRAVIPKGERSPLGSDTTVPPSARGFLQLLSYDQIGSSSSEANNHIGQAEDLSATRRFA